MNMPLKSIALLKNIELLSKAVDEVIKSPMHLPKMVSFSGFSGYGKSFACALVANKYRCFYCEIGSSLSISYLLDNILKEMGINPPKALIAKKVEYVIENLTKQKRPLILDEFDKLAKDRALEIIREIADKSGVPLILVGEENLPAILDRVERFSNRILSWVRAEPVSLEDAQKLSQLYCTVNIREDLLKKLVAKSQGRVRRVCVNLNNIQNESKVNGWKEVDLKIWGTREIYTGIYPTPRRI
ncbi:AAA family ATPase [Candidatus Hepatincolaceae symbiont of Richtersius coronifer]